jgi:8-oxo-dGTP pyrophosphatase MutT (NUDIX family)
VAVIRPDGRPPGLWALPKGQIGDGETGEEAALRETAEETGVYARPAGKLGDIKYWFNWDGERIFKVVSFFLLRYERGRLGAISDEFRHEVADVRWLRLTDAAALLAYDGERQMVERALARLPAHGKDV